MTMTVERTAEKSDQPREWETEFLEGFRLTGSVKDALTLATISDGTFYEHKRRSPRFAALYEDVKRARAAAIPESAALDEEEEEQQEEQQEPEEDEETEEQEEDEASQEEETEDEEEESPDEASAVLPKDSRAIAYPSEVTVISALSETETAFLSPREAIIERGQKTFLEVGRALSEIRDDPRQVYRLYGTFEFYCRERWGFTDRRARQLMGAAQMVHRLSEGQPKSLPLPTSEREARPLTLLPPEKQPEVWNQVVESAAGEKVTTYHIEKVVRRALKKEPPPPKPTSRTWPGREKGAVRVLTVAVCDCAEPQFVAALPEKKCGYTECPFDQQQVHQHRRCRQCETHWIEVFVDRKTLPDGVQGDWMFQNGSLEKG